MKRSRAIELGQPILAKFIGATVVGLEPRIMGIGPALAIPKVLGKVGLKIEDVDVFEINEAFASMVRFPPSERREPRLSTPGRLLCEKAWT
jgi:acetyl-CoA acyltransferase 1